MAATPILILVYLKPELDLPEIPLQVVVGNAIWVLLILMIGWKYYFEIWKPKQKKKKKERSSKRRASPRPLNPNYM